MNSRKLSIIQAAKAYGIHRNTLARWLRDGRLAGVPVGRAVVLDERDLLRAMARTCAFCRANFIAPDPRRIYCGPLCERKAGDVRAKDRRAAAHKPRGRPRNARAVVQPRPPPPAIVARLPKRTT